MSIKSQILGIKILQRGDELGYSSGYIADKMKQIAVIGVGYGDGIRRDLKGFYVLVNGRKCKIIGNICMDCLFADVTGVLCQAGDEVSFERADNMARYLGTISYEVLTSISNFRSEYVIY